MKWPRLRLTVRRMMALVLVMGVGAHLAVTAWRVDRGIRQFKNVHAHTAIIDRAPVPGWYRSVQAAPFWPAYWRALLGRSWEAWPLARPLCRPSPPILLLEWCELAHLGELYDPPGKLWAVYTKQQKDLFIQMARRKGLDVAYNKDGDVEFRSP